MILSDDTRYMHECTFTVKQHPVEAPDIPLETVTELLTHAFQNDKGHYSFTSGKKVLRIQTIQEDDSTITLLFQLADSTASDPTFAHLKTGESRKEAKREDEGLGLTAHLVISKFPAHGRPENEFLAILEEVPGINVGVVTSALTSILRGVSNLTYKEDSKTSKKYRPLATLEHNAKTTLNEYLTKGVLTGVTFVQQEINEKLDDKGEIVEYEHKTLIKVPRAIGDRAMEVIEKISECFKTKKNGMLRITIKDKDNRQKTVSVLSDTEVRAAKIYSLNQKVHVKPEISTCQEQVHNDLEAKMKMWLEKRLEHYAE